MTAAALEAPVFAVRNRRPDDDAFIYSSFLRSYRQSKYTAGMGNDLLYAVMKAEWEKVMARFNVAVAHPVGEEDEIAGWVAWSDRVIAYLYVKKEPWRRMGVARLLLEHVGVKPGVFWQALYGSPPALALAKSKGLSVALARHVDALRILNVEVRA